jgi:hypothetical protein
MEAFYNIFCNHVNKAALAACKQSPAHGLFYNKRMKEDWVEVDRMIEVHSEMLGALLTVSQCPRRTPLEQALKKFNSLHQGVLFDDEDEDNVQSTRTQAGGIKLMLARVGRKHRNMINGERTSDVVMKLISKYKKAPNASPSPSPEPDKGYKRLFV